MTVLTSSKLVDLFLFSRQKRVSQGTFCICSISAVCVAVSHLFFRVNKQFISAAQTRLTVTSSTKDKEWVQIYKGIFTGLRLANVSVETCVKDGANIALYFEKAFEQFEDHAVYAGLHDLGVVINRVVKGMADCGIEEVLILKIEGFVKDLIECVKKGLWLQFIGT